MELNHLKKVHSWQKIIRVCRKPCLLRIRSTIYLPPRPKKIFKIITSNHRFNLAGIPFLIVIVKFKRMKQAYTPKQYTPEAMLQGGITGGAPTQSIRDILNRYFQQEFNSELVNSIIHGIGILFGLVAIPALLSIAVQHSHLAIRAGVLIYGIAFILVFTFSTIYHGLRESGLKNLFEKLDHISIYFLIAGTYTTLITAYMPNKAGFTMLSFIWVLTIIGTVFKSCIGCRYNIISTVVYMLMGWMMVWTGGSLFIAMAPLVVTLILTGGVLFSIGVIFFLWEKLKWHHAAWHCFALAGAICHYAAIVLTVK